MADIIAFPHFTEVPDGILVRIGRRRVVRSARLANSNVVSLAQRRALLAVRRLLLFEKRIREGFGRRRESPKEQGV